MLQPIRWAHQTSARTPWRGREGHFAPIITFKNYRLICCENENGQRWSEWLSGFGLRACVFTGFNFHPSVVTLSEEEKTGVSCSFQQELRCCRCCWNVESWIEERLCVCPNCIFIHLEGVALLIEPPFPTRSLKSRETLRYCKKKGPDCFLISLPTAYI